MLSLRLDAFSAQFSRPEDPRFWIRIELPAGEDAIVSDFFPGALDDYQMAAALAQALERLEIRRLSSLTFRKLGPVGADETAEVLQRIGRVLDAFAVRTRRFIDARQLLAEHGQQHLRVNFVRLSHPGGHA